MNHDSDSPSKDDEKCGAGRSTLISRNVTIAGHRTSVRLEPDMWSALNEIRKRERTHLHQICTDVAARKHSDTSLTAAIRVFVMAYFRSAATEEGHVKAGHGYNGSTIGAPANNAQPMQRHSSSVTVSSGQLYPMAAANKISGGRY
jgi:predicted DNA-binding ribbon-helix-helix protein